jgi:hypothetical protein
MYGVFTTARAKLLDREFFRNRALVFIGDVVVALTVLTGQFDEISHGVLRTLR